MPILRGHHLICLHFFNGEGYDRSFIDNLRNVISQASDESITITSEADDVCGSCPWLKKGKCEQNKSSEDHVRDMDSTALELLLLEDGESKSWSNIRDRIPDIFSQWYNMYCMDCGWNLTCEKNEFYETLEEGL
ncbi:MAG: DUF1284 domain-containing protein [Nitrospirota bacterium]|nr:MAG: DUF1284 domain-containing protein [Nitrospirota bacterium]